ncbi:MAG: 16S rRNA (uracil(1498)-N(3))-methyltransferase [Nitrospirota bacterium]
MHRLPRFFITPDQVQDRGITIVGDDVHHIRSVLRMQLGDMLTLSNGQGIEYVARITDITKQKIKAEIVSESEGRILLPQVILGQGLPKSDTMDLIVQKATELGVEQIVPLITERTVVKIGQEQKRISRWQKISLNAAKQSDRSTIPHITDIQSFTGFLNSLESRPDTLFLIPDEHATGSLKQILREQKEIQKVTIVIGPEGGFSEKELQAARSKNFHPISLGSTILRTETAALAALSIIRYEFHT